MTATLSPRRGGFVTLVGCIALVVSGAPGRTLSSQSQPPRDAAAPPPPPVGTSRITGQVVAADNGTPVKRASVTIVGRSWAAIEPGSTGAGRGGVSSGVAGGVVGGVVYGNQASSSGGRGSGPFPLQVTDDAGRFEFGELPAGTYSIMVSPRSGFVRPPKAQQVEVAEGKSATATFRLERTGVITGRLLDESGDPLPRARVTAMRRERMAGGRLIPTGMGDTTDDLGQFRLFDLPPGEYFVSGSDAAYGPMMNAPGPSQGFAPTYFPGSPSLDAARPVVVKSAQETPGIEFSLARVAMGRLSGTVRDSTGQVLSGRGSVSVTRRGEDAVGFNRGSGVRPDGSFTIAEIPPGDYYVVANVYMGEAGPNVPREGAYVPVSVNGNDAVIDIQTNKGASVRGRVVVEGSPPAMPDAIELQTRPDLPRISVQARPMPFGTIGIPTGMSRPATPAEDGTFELTGIRGPAMITASGMRLAFKSVTYGAEDLTGRQMEFKGTERVSNVTIVMTYEVGTLQGMVTGERGEPVPGASVIIFPEEDSRWFQGSPFVHYSRATPARPASAIRPPTTAATPGMPAAGRPAPAPGSYQSSTLLPGRYFVTAIEGDGVGVGLMDRDSLERLRKHAVVATVTAGAAATVQLRAVKTF
jgi:hypothetical protein